MGDMQCPMFNKKKILPKRGVNSGGAKQEREGKERRKKRPKEKG